MALFEQKDIGRSFVPAKSGAISHPDHVSFWDRTQKKIEDAFASIEFLENTSTHFVSDGAWSMHDLLHYFLIRFGAAKVYITTWAISEIAMRQLYNFSTDGLITKLYVLIDYRNTSRKPAELGFISKNATKINLAKCHAKVTIIETESKKLTVVTSANYTKNPRIEAGVITISNEVARLS